MNKKKLLQLETAPELARSARGQLVPSLTLPPTGSSYAKAQSARPFYDSLVQREINSARSSLYSEELENSRLQQQIRYLTDLNVHLTAELNHVRLQLKTPQIVEVLPESELLSQNLRLEQENDHLRCELARYQCADSQIQTQLDSPTTNELQNARSETQHLRECVQQLQDQVRALTSGTAQKTLDDASEVSTLRERVSALEAQHRSNLELSTKYNRALQEIERLRDELETEKGAFLEFLHMQDENTKQPDSLFDE